MEPVVEPDEIDIIIGVYNKLSYLVGYVIIVCIGVTVWCSDYRSRPIKVIIGRSISVPIYKPWFCIGHDSIINGMFSHVLKDFRISRPCDASVWTNISIGLPDGACIDGNRPTKPEGKYCAEENSQQADMLHSSRDNCADEGQVVDGA